MYKGCRAAPSEASRAEQALNRGFQTVNKYLVLEAWAEAVLESQKGVVGGDMEEAVGPTSLQ